MLRAYHATLHKTWGLIANGRGRGQEARVMARGSSCGCQPSPLVPKCWHCLNLQREAAPSRGGRIRKHRDAHWWWDPLLDKLWRCHHCQPSHKVSASPMASVGLSTAGRSQGQQCRSPCSCRAYLGDALGDTTSPHRGFPVPLRECCKTWEGGQSGFLTLTMPSTVLWGTGLWGPDILPTISITPFANQCYNIPHK